MALLKPKEVVIRSIDGEEKTYTISRFPAIAGREIIAGYPLTGIPKFGEYAANEAIMLKLMCYVAITLPNDEQLTLKTKALIDNHVPDTETLVKLELEMLKYNTSFFQKGGSLPSLEGIAQTFLLRLSPMLMRLSEQLWAQVKQRSKNLDKITI